VKWEKDGLEALKAQSSPKRGMTYEYAGKYKKLSLKTQNIQVLDYIRVSIWAHKLVLSWAILEFGLVFNSLRSENAFKKTNCSVATSLLRKKNYPDL
jgi:hypothetical protein